MKLKLLMALLGLLTLSGCVAVWGKSYNVATANEQFIQINYDSSVDVNYVEIFAIAKEHCGKFDKDFVNDSTVTNGWGITYAIYKCIDRDVTEQK